MNNYEDIINLERPKSNHSHLSVESRAAQFAPFAALVGYDSAIKETARITDKRIEIDDELKVIISNKLNYLNDHIKDNNKVIITYFIKDEKKSGGNYIHKTGIIKHRNAPPGWLNRPGAWHTETAPLQAIKKSLTERKIF